MEVYQQTVVNSVVAGGVEYPFNGAQFPDDTSMEPKLIHQIELVVNQKNNRRYK